MKMKAAPTSPIYCEELRKQYTQTTQNSDLILNAEYCLLLLITHSEISNNFFFTRYDENTQSMDVGFPKEITQDFPGVGKKVDAVFQDGGKDVSLLCT